MSSEESREHMAKMAEMSETPRREGTPALALPLPAVPPEAAQIVGSGDENGPAPDIQAPLPCRPLQIDPRDPVFTHAGHVFLQRFTRLWERQSKSPCRWPDPIPFRARCLAEFLVWDITPPWDRPDEWPKTHSEFAARWGLSLRKLNQWLHKVKYVREVRPQFVYTPTREEQLQVVTSRVQHEIAIAPPGQLNAQLVRAEYQRLGAIGADSQTNIVNVNGVTIEDDRERAGRIEAYLRERGTILPVVPAETLPEPDKHAVFPLPEAR